MSRYLHVDPPGPDKGWLHEIASADDIDLVLGKYDIPADNEERRRDYDAAHEGESVEQYQSGRDFWGITFHNSRPNPLPEGVELVPLEPETQP